MKKIKYISIAVIANISILSYAQANEQTDISLSLTTTIDTLLQQNLEDLQPLNLAEDAKQLIASNTPRQDRTNLEMKGAEKANNNTAKLTD